MADRPVGERVSLVEQIAHGHERELSRVRERLHDLESDRATLWLIAQQLRDLSASVEKVAVRAATEAVTQAMKARESEDREDTGVRLDRVAVVVALVGTAASIYFNAR